MVEQLEPRDVLDGEGQDPGEGRVLHNDVGTAGDDGTEGPTDGPEGVRLHHGAAAVLHLEQCVRRREVEECVASHHQKRHVAETHSLQRPNLREGAGQQTQLSATLCHVQLQRLGRNGPGVQLHRLRHTVHVLTVQLKP